MRIGVGKLLYELRFGHRDRRSPHLQAISLPNRQTSVKRPSPGAGESRMAQVFSSVSSWWRARLIAAPRISPRLAPESEDPNSAIARFSSSTSRALIDRDSLRVVRSIAV